MDQEGRLTDSVVRLPWCRWGALALALMVASGLPVMAFPGLETKLVAFDAALDDFFGFAVAVDGDTLVVGTPSDGDEVGQRPGSAHVFVRSGTGWTQESKFVASDGQPDDLFAYSVSISGDIAVVGAPFDDDAGESSGSAYVFVRTGSFWSEEAKLTAGDAAAGDEFGFAVSIRGETVVVGAPLDDDAGESSGSAYVFVRDGSGWSEQAKLTASDAEGGGDFGDEFGVAVSIDGDTVVVGAHFESEGGATAGAAYVFVRDGVNWDEEAKLTAGDPAPVDRFGRAVSISGESIAVSSRLDDDGGVDSGSVYVFGRTGSLWNQEAKLTASDAEADDGFGYSVGISGDSIVVSGHLNDDACPADPICNSGSAYVFVRDGAGWTEEVKLIASDTEMSDFFGFSVAISGETVVVGAPLTDDEGESTGSAYVFGGCRLVLDVDYDVPSSTLDLNFSLGSSEPGAWTTWLSVGTSTVPLWSIPVPEMGLPVSIPVSIPGFPQIGTIGFLTTLTTGEGIVCSAWETVDTGAGAGVSSARDLGELFASQSPSP